MIALCKKLAASSEFERFTLLLILTISVTLGLETNPFIAESFESVFTGIFYVTQVAFVIEIAVRVIAFSPNYKLFFKNFWNIFDFTIVLISLVPAIGSFILVARLLRLLRVLRLVSGSATLRNFLLRMKESFDEAICAGFLALVLGYIFSLSGFYLFSDIDPIRWGSLGKAALSVFLLATLQSVEAVVVIVIQQSSIYIVYFLMFYFVLFTLIIGTVCASLIQAIRPISNE